MKRFALVILFAMTSVAYAQQQPREIVTDNKIDMSVGQTKRLSFKDPFGQIVFSQKEIAEALPPQGDQEFAFVAKAPGITRLIVTTADGKTLYDAEIYVNPDRGHLVRIYNTGKNEDLNAGYSAVYCDQFGCSRPDKDLPQPTSVIVNRQTLRGSGARPVSPPPGGAGF